MKEQFINCYPLSKTLQFSLIPVGKTEDNFNKNLLLEKDKQRAKNYEMVKGYIDRFHKEYIESVLSKARKNQSKTELLLERLRKVNYSYLFFLILFGKLLSSNSSNSKFLIVIPKTLFIILSKGYYKRRHFRKL